MPTELFDMKVIAILTFGFALASFFGYLSLKMKLSPIMGYLVAGYLIGPNSPGFVADKEIACQLAEIGVILMMFGVGLHFKWSDLVKVKALALPGAIGQTVLTTAITAVIMHLTGWSWEAGGLFGIATGVASTVVLVRVLTSCNLIHSTEGKISIGWLIVEDIITVAALLLIPTLAAAFDGIRYTPLQITFAFSWAIVKFIALALVMCTVGKKIVGTILTKVLKTRSHELFLLGILAVTFVITTSSSYFFGTSIALGAFVAGMAAAQTSLRQKVLLTATPLKDTFVVLFFLSVGMIFNPIAIKEHIGLFFTVLSIVLLIKPFFAFLIATILKYPPKTAVTVAIALAQIGEFSFVMADQSVKYGIMPHYGYDILVACALISLSINPSLFKFMNLSKKNSTA